jgi:hypothetical protein
MSAAWNWFKSDGSLPLRIGIGVVVFAILAAVDLRRKRRQATRWREYLFLLAAVGVALAYGMANDQVTSRLSWEYYYYGKGLDAVLGPQTPPDPGRLSWEAAKVGMKATWSVGLLIGAALLVANNPRPGPRRLSYPRLLARLPSILLSAVAAAALLGALGYRGWLTFFSEDFQEMVRHNEFRPHRFMLVYGIHLGGYLGGLIGTIRAVVTILSERRFAGGSTDT